MPRTPSSAIPQPAETNAAKAPDDAPSRDVRELLFDAAEHLFAQHGIEGVSLREIGVKAGQRNNSTVHYHFGDKQGLVDMLLADRFGRVERLRQQMIDQAGDLSACDAVELLRLMWQPLVDIDAGRNGHWFIRLQLACHLQNSQAGHPLGNDPASYPASGQIMDAIRKKFGHLTTDHFYYRLGLLALMFWSAVCWHDKVAASTNQRWSTRFSLSETVKLAASALSAPA